MSNIITLEINPALERGEIKCLNFYYDANIINEVMFEVWI